ncbi:hypothetical protein OG21DRAFT_1522521 [Imleria badia]|nr:hypothetical protein OG21DRAFT_1522521 [Imleria badia]
MPLTLPCLMYFISEISIDLVYTCTNPYLVYKGQERRAGIPSLVLLENSLSSLLLELASLASSNSSSRMSAIIKKEESPLVIPLLFEETGDAKKEDRQSPSLSSYQTRSPIEPARGYTPHAPSYYNPSTPIRSPLLLLEPIDWEQILVIPCHSPISDDGSSTVVESIGGILHRAFLLSEVSDVIREGVQLGVLQREQERHREEIRQRVIEAYWFGDHT